MTELSQMELDKKEFNIPIYNNEHFYEMVKYQLNPKDPNNEGDEFYKKLLELKNEQKQTLMYMQELYNQKTKLKEDLLKSQCDMNELKVAPKTLANTDNYNFLLNTVSAYDDGTSTRPLAELTTSTSPNVHQFNENIRTSKYHYEPALPPPAPSRVTINESLNRFNHQRRDDNDHDDEEHMLESDSMKEIERIWRDFKFEQENRDNKDLKSIHFNQKFKQVKRPRSVNATRKEASRVEWAPRITVPEPFSMSIREKLKSESKKQLIEKEVQRQRELELERQLMESNKKFRANPVPAQVYMPLYEKLKQEEAIRKMKLKKKSKEYMEAVSKPFNLTETKKAERTRRHSYSEGQNDENYKFFAKPLPEFYTQDDLQERAREDETMRQLRTRARSIEMLHRSKLPKNLQLQHQKNRIKRMNMELESESAAKHSEQHRANKYAIRYHDVPNYDEMYRKFMVEFEMQKARKKKNTVVEPFRLRSASRTRPKPPTDNSKRPKTSNSSSLKTSQSVSLLMDTLPVRSTQSQKLRESVNKEKLNEMTQRELQKEHIEKMKKLREKKIHDQIQEKINYDPDELRKKIERQTRKLKLEQKQREEEYERELAEKHSKIDNRKLQVEQLEEEQIKKMIEKKYNESLRKAGLEGYKI